MIRGNVALFDFCGEACSNKHVSSNRLKICLLRLYWYGVYQLWLTTDYEY